MQGRAAANTAAWPSENNYRTIIKDCFINLISYNIIIRHLLFLTLDLLKLVNHARGVTTSLSRQQNLAVGRKLECNVNRS